MTCTKLYIGKLIKECELVFFVQFSFIFRKASGDIFKIRYGLGKLSAIC